MIHCCEHEVYDEAGHIDTSKSCQSTIEDYLSTTDYSKTKLCDYLAEHQEWWKNKCPRSLSEKVFESLPRGMRHRLYMLAIGTFPRSIIYHRPAPWHRSENRICSMGRNRELCGTGIQVYKYVNSEKRAVVVKQADFVSDYPEVLLHEACILSMLYHPNIIRMEDFIVSETTMCIVMAEAAGTLNEAGSTLRARQREYVSYQILVGVSYLHSMGVMHGDLKSENILLYWDEGSPSSIVATCGKIPRAVIADFGLSYLRGVDNPPKTDSIVTLWWRSPEMLITSEYAEPADVWAIGCIIYDLITGIIPFRGSDESEQAREIFKTLGTPTPETWPDGSKIPLPYSYSEGKIFISHSPLATSFLDKIFVLDPAKRATIPQLLEHSIFDQIRHLVKSLSPFSPGNTLQWVESRTIGVARGRLPERYELYNIYRGRFNIYKLGMLYRGIELYERLASRTTIPDEQTFLALYVALYWILITSGPGFYHDVTLDEILLWSWRDSGVRLTLNDAHKMVFSYLSMCTFVEFYAVPVYTLLRTCGGSERAVRAYRLYTISGLNCPPHDVVNFCLAIENNDNEKIDRVILSSLLDCQFISKLTRIEDITLVNEMKKLL